MGTQILSALPGEVLPLIKHSSLKKWLVDVLLTVRPLIPTVKGPVTPINFIFDLTLAAYLAFTLYPEDVVQYTRIIPALFPERIVPTLTRAPDGYIVHDLFAFLEGATDHYLFQGFLFLKCVFKLRISGSHGLTKARR